MKLASSPDHPLKFITSGLKKIRNFATLVLNIISHAPKTVGEISECLRIASREHYQSREKGIPNSLLFLELRGVIIDFSELKEGTKNIVREFYKNPDTKDIICVIVKNIILK